MLPADHPSPEPDRSGYPADRPRERLRSLGPEALTTVELLTAVIGSGGGGASAGEIAGAWVDSTGGGLRDLARLSLDGLAARPGLGPATAARLVAALELGRRAAIEPSVIALGSVGPQTSTGASGPG